MKPIVTNDEVVNDAVRLLKTDFVSLYKELGHDPARAGSLWHEIRVSPKGIRLRASIGGSLVNSATSFISDIKEEAKVRLKKQKGLKFIDTITNEDITDQVSQSFEDGVEKEQVEQVVKIKTNLNNKTMAKGDKASQVKALVDSGVTDVNTIVEKVGVNKLYAKNLLKKFGVVEVKKEKKAAKPKKEKKEAAAEVETEA